MASCADTARPFLLWGAAQPPNQSHVFKAGPLSFVFEPDTAFLRYVSYRGHELLRGVYAAVRGAGWVTITPHISHVRIRHTRAGTSLSFHAACQAFPVWFEWDGTVRAFHDGSITFSFDGVACMPFLRNRIGFCVLHPDSCAGLPCTIEHVDGTVTHGAFPILIAPHQPFLNIRAISYTHPSGIELRVVCEGDIFEMEDQRNWTDASFKTYCTPLALPAPAQIDKGTRVRQTITIHARVLRSVAPPARVTRTVHASLREHPVAPPLLGLGLPMGGAAFGDYQRSCARALAPAHLRAELHLASPRWRDDLRSAAHAARSLRTALELALVLPSQSLAPLSQGARACAHIAPLIARCFVLMDGKYVPSENIFARALKIIQAHLPTTPVGTGAHRYFTELNRSRPPLTGAAAICYSCNPQVHTFDHASIVETFSGQACTVRSARAFCASLPLFISPLTLKPRPAPDAALADTSPPAWADPRQASLFGLGFALGSIAHLAEAGAAGLTLFDLSGWNGVMDAPHCGWLIHLFGRCGVYPVYHLLADLAECAGGSWHTLAVSDARRAAGLALVRRGHTVLLLSNLTPHPLSLTVARLRGTPHLRILDESNVRTALFEPERFRSSSTRTATLHNGSLSLRLRANAYARIHLT